MSDMDEGLDPYELENLDNAFWFNEISRLLWKVEDIEDNYADEAFRVYKNLPVETHDDLVMYLFGTIASSNVTLKKMIEIMKGRNE